MFVIHVASEFSKLVKVGGLGDVVYGLSKQLCLDGDQVLVILPFYDTISKHSLRDLKLTQSINSPTLGKINYYLATIDSILVVLVEETTEKKYFRRKKFMEK